MTEFDNGPGSRLVGFCVFICALAFFALVFAPIILLDAGTDPAPVKCECIGATRRD